MAEALTLTDTTMLDSVLSSPKPVMLLLTTGEGLRSDFTVAFRAAAENHPDITFARIDPVQNPQMAERFQIGSKPVLIGWLNGKEVVRRPRPWGTDVPLAIELLQAALKDQTSFVIEEQKETASMENNKPVNVTDSTFQQEVIDYELPVLIDFWAEWCGPCRQVAPILDQLANEFAGQIRIAKVNVDENPQLQAAFRVSSIPNIMLIKQQTIVFNQPGALPEPALRDLIQQLIALEIPPQNQPAN